MQDQLDLQDIVLLGRTFDEYYQMFQLESLNLQNERILDVASGVSSFCAEANARGYDVKASDRIYNLPPRKLEHKGKQDLNNVMRQLPELSHLYRWDRFRSVEALRANRERALRLFVADYSQHAQERYAPTDYPASTFKDKGFIISLVSHFLFLYEDLLDYNFHKRTLRELTRITSKEIRIFPIVDLRGVRSSYVDRLLSDNDFHNLLSAISKVNYEFMINANELLTVYIR